MEMATIVSEIGAFFTGAIGWVGELVEMIGSNPLLLIMCVAIPVAGVAFGYLGRLFRA